MNKNNPVFMHRLQFCPVILAAIWQLKREHNVNVLILAVFQNKKRFTTAIRNMKMPVQLHSVLLCRHHRLPGLRAHR